jgi:hypothetical protein
VAKIYRFPNLEQVYYHLHEVKKLYNEGNKILVQLNMCDCNDEEFSSLKEQITEINNNIKMHLEAVANELVPEEKEYVEDLMDCIMNLIHNGLEYRDIVRIILIVRKEYIARGLLKEGN